MSATALAPSPLADAAVEHVIALMRTTRMPHARAVVAEVLATAKAQRWDPTEVIRVLLEAEATGRNRSMLATRRKRAGFPTGKTFEVWDESLSTLPAATTSFLRTLERSKQPAASGQFQVAVDTLTPWWANTTTKSS